MIFTSCKIKYNSDKFKTISFPSRIDISNSTEWEYIAKYYDEILKQLDPEEAYKSLDDCVIIDEDKKIDRFIISGWLELMLNKEIPEILVNDQEVIKTNKPEYIKDYLESYIKSQTDMEGFHYLHYWYISKKNKEYFNKISDDSKRKI